MSNVLRTIVPNSYKALMGVVGDPITYTRGTSTFPAVVVFSKTAKAENIQFGNVLRAFISLEQAGGVEPAIGDGITFNAKTYRVKEVEANDLEGYQLTLRAI